MRRKASLWAGVAGIALVSSLGSAPMAMAQQADAQTADAQTATVIEDIVVQARRRDERLIDVPVAITAIGGESLSDYSVSRVSDLATLVPSLVTGKAASGSSASIFLRGVGSTALSAGFDQSVSFVIDGLPMSRGREISLPQFDIQNVEVLKGPQALFYGKNTTGGLINVNSNNPTANFEAGAKTGYGFEGQEWYGEAYVSGPITDTLRGRFAARLSDSKGAFTNTAADTYPALVPGQDDWHRPSDHRGGAQSRAARLTLDWDPTSQLSVRLKAGMTSVDDGGPTDIIERICGGGRTTPASANGLPPSPNADCKIDGRSDSSALPRNVAEANYRYARDGEPYAEFGSEYAVVTAKWKDDKFDVESITGYYHFDQYDLNNVSGEAYPASFTQFADFTQYSQELRFETKFDGPINFSTGAFWARGEFEFNTDAYIIPLPLDPVTGSYVTFRRDNGFKSDSMSVFAQASWAIGDQWELSGGGRYSKEKRDSYQRSLDGHSFVAANFPGGIQLYDEYDDDNFSPEVTLRYKPAHDTTIYAAYKQGFKAGGFNVSQALTPDASVEKGRFGAETAQGFEAGLRTLALDRRLNLGITAYHYLYEDLQVQYYDPQTNSLTAGNAGKLRTMDAEALLGVAGQALPVVEKVADETIAALSAEAVGVLRRMLRDTVAYTGQRRQFGKPLSELQVLQHRMVEMFMQVEAADSAVLLATLNLEAPTRQRARAVSAAKVTVGEACRFVGQNAIQLHGGMGMTDDLPLGHYFKRAMAIDAEFGSEDHHLQRYGALAGG